MNVKLGAGGMEKQKKREIKAEGFRNRTTGARTGYATATQ